MHTPEFANSYILVKNDTNNKNLKNSSTENIIQFESENCVLDVNNKIFELKDGNINEVTENGDTKQVDSIPMDIKAFSIFENIANIDENNKLTSEDIWNVSTEELQETSEWVLEDMGQFNAEAFIDKDGVSILIEDKNKILSYYGVEFTKENFGKKLSRGLLEALNIPVPANLDKISTYNIEIKTEKLEKETEEINLNVMEQIAQEAGVSEFYVKNLLFGLEGRSEEPALTPYNDGYGDNGGTWTIGYGHTGEVNGIKMSESNADSIKITKEEACSFLAEDVKKLKKYAIYEFTTRDDIEGINANLSKEARLEKFNKAPQSIQDAIVDIAFNRGQSNIPDEVIANVINEDYVTAIKEMFFSEDDKGLKKRNLYRAIMATKDLDETTQKLALDGIKDYYDETRELFKGTGLDETLITKAWENANEGNYDNFFV